MTTFGELGFGAGAFGGVVPYLPDMTVEVAFDTDPLDPSPVWTDITEYVSAERPTTVRGGRASVNDDVQPGTLSLTLDNTDGRFTAGLSSSPYYPNVTINRRIRVRATWDGVTYPVFDGHVDRWPVGWENGVRALAPITATDRSKLLARRPLRTLYEQEVLADGPLAFYPMQEDDGAVVFGDVSGYSRPPGRVQQTKYGDGDWRFGINGPNNYTALGLNDEPLDTPLARGTGYFGDLTSVAPALSPAAMPAGFTFECWVKWRGSPSEDLAGNPDGVFPVFVQKHPGGPESRRGLSIVMLSNSVSVYGYASSTSYQAVSAVFNADPSWSALGNGEWHHVAVTFTSTDTKVFVDGAEGAYAIAGPVWSYLPDESPILQAVGHSMWQYAAGEPEVIARGQFAFVAFYDSALSATRILEHYRMGDPDFTELSSARVERLAGYAGVPVGAVEVGRSLVSNRQDTIGESAGSALQQVATSEAGLVFFAPDGDVEFHGRGHRMNQASSFTLDAAQDQVGADLEFELSDAEMVNDIAVDRPRGGPVRVVDETSIDAHGTYAEQVSTILTSDDETLSFGQWQEFLRGTPRIRAGQVSIQPLTEEALWTIALGTGLGTRFTVENLPAAAPASSVELVVEGYEHTFSVGGWWTSWDTSPADAREFLTWDSSSWDAAVWAW